MPYGDDEEKSFVTLTPDVRIAGSPFYFFMFCIPQIWEMASPSSQIKNTLIQNNVVKNPFCLVFRYFISASYFLHVI